MRDVILFNLVTLDGFFEGPDHDISWHRVDEEFNEFAWEQINAAGAILFGRVTYEMMASFWPSPEALRDDPVTANLMNTWPKVVFSRTLHEATWANTRLVKADAVGEVQQLKQQPGKDLFIFGSANLASSLTRAELIDEYRILVNPVVLGKGVPLFQSVDHTLDLELKKTRNFQNGNVLLTYRIPGKEN